LLIDCKSKIGIAIEESDESAFWLKFLKRADIKDAPEGTELLNEAKELLAIFTQSAKTASTNRQ
jgi:four helix bundle protein